MANFPAIASSRAAYPEFLHRFCKEVSFDAGEVIRRQGHHYEDVLLVTQGAVDVQSTASGARAGTSMLGPGAAIGEIGFLRGCEAAATLVARAAVGALVINDDTLWEIEKHAPKQVVQFCRFLGRALEARDDGDTSMLSWSLDRTKFPNIDVFLCRDDSMLNEVMRLRYQMCCEEAGRKSPHLDHANKILRDPLDALAHMFVAVVQGEVIGSLRTNFAREGGFGFFEELYGMSRSRNHPARTAICSKFIIKKSKRGTPAYLRLCTEWLRYAMSRDIVECYIICEPKLAPLYATLGFKPSAERFYHYEFGVNQPMMLDLLQHGRRLCGLAGLRSSD